MQTSCAKLSRVYCAVVLLVHLTLMLGAFGQSIVSRSYTVPEKRMSELLYGRFGTGYHCLHNGRIVMHGHIYKTTRCLSSRCFFGASFIHSDGCEDSNGECHDVNSVWTENCVSYRCRKTSKNGYNYYQPVLDEALCRDVEGRCHRPGETFTVRLDDTLHDNCQCYIKQTMIYYRCILNNY